MYKNFVKTLPIDYLLLFQGTTTKRSNTAKDKLTDMYKGMMGEDETDLKDIDHTPHDLFVEMDELVNNEWVEQARWIKYEEAREPGAERWGKPHVSTLSFHSLINLRIHLERGIILLDLEARDLANLHFTIVEEWVEAGILDEDLKPDILRTLLYKHKHVHGERGHSVASRMVSMRKNFSGTSLSSTKHSGKNSDVESGQRGSFVAGHLASAMMTHAASVASAAGLDSESVCTFTVWKFAKINFTEYLIC